MFAWWDLSLTITSSGGQQTEHHSLLTNRARTAKTELFKYPEIIKLSGTAPSSGSARASFLTGEEIRSTLTTDSLTSLFQAKLTNPHNFRESLHPVELCLVQFNILTLYVDWSINIPRDLLRSGERWLVTAHDARTSQAGQVKEGAQHITHCYVLPSPHVTWTSHTQHRPTGALCPVTYILWHFHKGIHFSWNFWSFCGDRASVKFLRFNIDV